MCWIFATNLACEHASIIRPHKLTMRPGATYDLNLSFPRRDWGVHGRVPSNPAVPIIASPQEC